VGNDLLQGNRTLRLLVGPSGSLYFGGEHKKKKISLQMQGLAISGGRALEAKGWGWGSKEKKTDSNRGVKIQEGKDFRKVRNNFRNRNAGRKDVALRRLNSLNTNGKRENQAEGGQEWRKPSEI